MPDADRNANGRFLPGRSGNPAGRQAGSLNKATLAVNAMLDARAEELTSRLGDLTRMGNPTALRICFDRLAPPRKGRPVPFALGKLESHADAVDVAASIVTSVADGELTPQEATDLIKVVEAFARVQTVADLQWRVRTLERAQEKAKEA